MAAIRAEPAAERSGGSEKPGLTQAVEQGCYDAVREFAKDLMISLTEQLSTEAVAKETEATWQQLADDGDELAMQLAHIASAIKGVPISAVATVLEASAEALLRSVVHGCFHLRQWREAHPFLCLLVVLSVCGCRVRHTPLSFPHTHTLQCHS